MTIREIGGLLRSRKLSCVELIQQTLSDIKTRDKFNSFINMTPEAALTEAVDRDDELARGMDRGVFHGIPIALKDLFYTQGVRTTAGSSIYRDFVPSYDATVVTKLREAGAICVGKTNLHELAFGITSKNPHYGPVLNPLDTTRIPGGSSGGSAALVGAGLVPMCLGTDTGGSIRIPASYCGIVGLKPTYGLVSRHGVLPLAFSLDHVGPLASCVEDCALTMDVIADSGAPFSGDQMADLAGVRAGIPETFFFDRVDEEVRTAVNAAIQRMEELGSVIVRVQIPNLEEATAAARVIQLAEVAALYVHQTDSSLFGEDVWALIQQGKMIAGHEYVNAQRIRTLFRREFDVLWKNVDVLVGPTTPITAPRLDQKTIPIDGQVEDTRMATTRLVRWVNFLGEPALSMPCGKASNDMPIGLQLIGAPFAERRLMQIAGKLELALGSV
ncbi:MAG: aspartyl/glutamyl-tRNA amidotransferase subunit A [Acidobacteriota bacterium]|nr:aspartyl/glutamyl-tRNA amidotransferase subunit A [Acidobacteriota bacterium]